MHRAGVCHRERSLLPSCEPLAASRNNCSPSLIVAFLCVEACISAATAAPTRPADANVTNVPRRVARREQARGDRWRSPLTIFFEAGVWGVCAKSLGYRKGKGGRAGARDTRLIINGHGAVVRNPGELNGAQGAENGQDGRLKVVRTKRSASRELCSPPPRRGERKLFLRLTRAGDFSLYNETAWTLSSRTFNDDNLSALLARHDLKYRWPSFRSAANDSVRLSLSGTGTATAV